MSSHTDYTGIAPDGTEYPLTVWDDSTHTLAVRTDRDRTWHRSTEVSRDELERLAFTARAAISMPGPDGGWARLTLTGDYHFHAWVPAVEGSEVTC